MNNNSKFISFLILFVSLFIFVFLTLDFYSTLQVNLDQKSTLEGQFADKSKQKSNLETIKKQVESWKNPEVAKYVFEFKEDELIQYIYDFAQANESYMNIKQVTFEEGKQNEYGFKEGKIQIDARMGGEEIMMKFLDFLTSEDSKYSFFIDSFSYPNDGLAGSYNVSIPLKVFYK